MCPCLDFFKHAIHSDWWWVGIIRTLCFQLYPVEHHVVQYPLLISR